MIHHRTLRALPLFLAFVPLLAGQTRQFVDEGFSSFLSGELQGLSVSNEGQLETAPGLSLLTKVDDPIIWAAVPGENGSLILGTGNRGRVLRVDADGTVTTLFQPDQVMTRAIARDDAGNLYAGTSPNGAIYRLPADGGLPQVFFDPDPGFIWDMHVRDGALWVSTGMPARLLRIPLDERPPAAEEWFSARADHFTVIYPDEDGTWWVGSSTQGILYHVREKGEGFAAFNSSDREIVAITRPHGGNLVFATFSGEAAGGGGGGSGGSGGSGSSGSRSESGGGEESGMLSPVVVTADGGGSGNQSARSRGRSLLLELDANGFVRPLWQSREAGITALRNYGGDGRFWLIGMNTGGRLFGFADSANWSLIEQLPRGGEISALVPFADDPLKTWVTTSNPAGVHILGGEPSEEGVFTSTVRDAGQIARWGRLETIGSGDPLMQVETRSGNTREPDATWSDFEPIDWAVGEPVSGGAVVSPPSRFLQYRLTFDPASDGFISRVRGFFQMPNAAPLIADLAVLRGGFDFQVQTANGPVYDFDTAFTPAGRERLSGSQRERQQLRRSADDSHVTVVWRAADPNDDPLEFAVFLQRVGEDRWVKLADGLTQPLFNWNTRGLPDGVYRFRVTASDGLVNAEALTASRISANYLVDNTPPVIRLVSERVQSDGVELVFEAEDALSVLASARYSLDGGPSVSLRPEGGLFDSRQHRFVIRIRDLATGQRSLVFEAVDEAGQASVLTHTFQVTRS